MSQFKTILALSTLRTWAQKFPIQPGVLTGVLGIMKSKGKY